MLLNAICRKLTIYLLNSSCYFRSLFTKLIGLDDGRVRLFLRIALWSEFNIFFQKAPLQQPELRSN